MAETGHEALLESQEALLEGREALPEGREGSECPSGVAGGVKRSSQRTGMGWEVLTKDRDGSGGLSKGPGRVGGPPGEP